MIQIKIDNDHYNPTSYHYIYLSDVVVGSIHYSKTNKWVVTLSFLDNFYDLNIKHKKTLIKTFDKACVFVKDFFSGYYSTLPLQEVKNNAKSNVKMR